MDSYKKKEEKFNGRNLTKYKSSTLQNKTRIQFKSSLDDSIIYC